MTINTVTLSGNLGKDPELKYLESGTVIAAFSLAVQGFAKGEKKTLWFNCKAFGKVAEVIGEYLKKGSAVTITGRHDCDEWEKDGQKQKFAYIIVNDLQLPPKAEDIPF